jgi:VIT1/CCC1 family predicted Fe2+/Mn2+ transporter
MNIIYLFKKYPPYLKAAVYGANDGLVTTFAVVAGAAGAGLPVPSALILGISNVVADGLSMGLGDFLGERSERRIDSSTKNKIAVWHTGLITFLFFVLAGLLPLISLVLVVLDIPILINLSDNYLLLSSVTTGFAMFAFGSLRTLVTKGSWIKNGMEMLLVGMLAAALAYGLGHFLQRLFSSFLL